ncbi:glycoside hydrolase family 29 protein [Piloderma croceum F 1598]|uniref:alpha-L-fucosidase n=1 Tax=Piloderma croceum (strain F 1598) TaxID=765440 RepID=A0A0C3G5Z1_PILCF|nr:glycoside hydrolase family 29 protein [Piloderma croceum F 1598]
MSSCLQQHPFSAPFGDTYPSVVIHIDGIFNNQAASKNGAIADFDGHGSSFDAQYLPHGSWVYDEITYELPWSWGLRADNVLADNQIVYLPELATVHELHFLYAGDGTYGASEAKLELTFVDHSTEIIRLSAKSWWTTITLNVGAIQTPYHFESHGSKKNWNVTHVFQWSTAVSSYTPLKSITLPPPRSSDRLHLFAVSFTPSAAEQTVGPALLVRRARFTTKWEDVDGVRAQVVEVTIANLAPATAFSSGSVTSPFEVYIVGSDTITVSPGYVNRLVASDQVRVDVLVYGTSSNGNVAVQINNSFGKILTVSDGWPVTPLRETWTPDTGVLSTHETPTWWNQAKYGIFIHWGPYSVPAWAPPTSYAEWYDWSLHNPPDSGNPTWDHHLETFGKDVVYDDFFANFTGSKFNASAWLDLFDEAGAKYFVLTTKHHDGFALFDTGNTSHRNSVNLGPKRNFLAELFTTAKKKKPQMHRGTYFSLPEWFNPDYAPYGQDSWPGGLAHNAFNSSEFEPYTGRVNISNYLEDLQLPQMLDLAELYDTEIMWCDISGPNKTLEFAARYYNHAAAKGLQVTMNDRCGAVPDFNTPEYATFGATQSRKWETSEGMDPNSYGLNSATKPSQYKNGTTIIQTLVDVVSKNGNYLLNVGPNAEGEIIEPMVKNLLDAGRWLKYSGDCVYETVSLQKCTHHFNIVLRYPRPYTV